MGLPRPAVPPTPQAPWLPPAPLPALPLGKAQAVALFSQASGLVEAAPKSGGMPRGKAERGCAAAGGCQLCPGPSASLSLLSELDNSEGLSRRCSSRKPVMSLATASTSLRWPMMALWVSGWEKPVTNRSTTE